MIFVEQKEKKIAFSPRILAVVASSALLTGTSWILPANMVLAQSNTSVQIAQTEAIRATSAQKGELYLNNDRVYSYNLVTSNNTRIGGLYIPAGSTIRGRYEPAEGGLRYVVRSVVVNGRSYPLNAVSDVLEDVKDPRDTSAGSIAEDAGIGAVGGLILGEVFGDADVGEVIGGAAAGAAVGNVTADRVVVVEPDRPIVLYSR